jgi:hypothetical protein
MEEKVDSRPALEFSAVLVLGQECQHTWHKQGSDLRIGPVKFFVRNIAR